MKQEVPMFVPPVSAALLLLLTASSAAPHETAFVEWARGRIVPIDPAGQAFRALDTAIAPAQLIGVGESVHEAQPFLAFRLQLLQDFVKRHRVTALVLESGLPEAMALDDYVRGRTATVDFDATLPGGFGALEEIRRTMEWLREWNLGPGGKHPVAVYGADLPARSGSMVPALDRLQELTAGSADVKAAIDSVRPPAVQSTGAWWKEAAEKYATLSAEAKAALTSDVALLVTRVNALSRGERDRLEWARRLAQVVQQNEAVLRLGGFSPTAPRDQAMTENTLWVLGRLAAGERAVYWAHNAHVQRVAVQGPPLPPGRFPSAGMRFDAALGKQYFAIATAYGGPSMDKKTSAESGTVDGTLESVARGPFLLLLHGGPRGSSVESWLSEERRMRFQVDHLLVPLGRAFDAVAYFDRATRAARVPRTLTPQPTATDQKP
jgi:erythromycin esterase